MTKHIPVLLVALIFACVTINLPGHLFCQELVQKSKKRCSRSYVTEVDYCRPLPCAKGGQIMKLNKTDARKLSDQVIMLGKDPAFSYSFFQTLKFTVTSESLQDALDIKRKAYSLALINLLGEYGIEHEEFYGELDKIWGNSFVEYKLSALGTLSDLLLKRNMSMQKTWEGYLKGTQKFALNLVNECL
jgi:hypothetical protein